MVLQVETGVVFRFEDIEEVVHCVRFTANEVVVVRAAGEASEVEVLAVVRHLCKLVCSGE